jgi:hypothetical protein
VKNATTSPQHSPSAEPQTKSPQTPKVEEEIRAPTHYPLIKKTKNGSLKSHKTPKNAPSGRPKQNKHAVRESLEHG